MEKIIKGAPDSQSKDLIKENIDKLKQLFPQITSEGKIDFEVLKSLLGEELETEEEYYRFVWAGKSQARREAYKPSTATLRPAKEESLNWDKTQNLYLEGDNLEVLKLLQKSYTNKVKMIYIDPPYNTGKDFVYKDNYKDNLRNYQRITGQIDEEGNHLTTNTERDGRYHSNWLNMMYPRLILARNLLKEDGVIFVSIGVEEFASLKSIMDIVFGNLNFVEIFSWTKTSTPPALSTKSRKTNEYILCYEKNKNNYKYNGELLDGGDQPLLNSGNSNRILKFPKEKVFFKYKLFEDGRIVKGKPDRVKLIEDIEIVKGYATSDFCLEGEFKWTQEFLDKEISKGTNFIIKSNKLSIRFIREEEGYKRPTNLIREKIITPIINKTTNNVGTNEKASTYLNKLMGGLFFDYPKPVSLIRYLINFICNKNDLVLDFFSGSATTAHAVMQLNAEDGGNRKHIQVQLPEATDEKSEAYKAGYKTIAEIGKERIRRAGKKILEKKQEELLVLKSKSILFDEDQEKIRKLEENIQKLDIGFKVFKLDSSNIKAWDGDPTQLSESLQDAVHNIKFDRSEEDVLYEILLKYGLNLNLPIEERSFGEIKVYNIGMGALFICLSMNITTDIAEFIGKWKEELQPEICRVVFRDNGFKSDVVKTNTLQILKSYKIEDIKSL